MDPFHCHSRSRRPGDSPQITLRLKLIASVVLASYSKVLFGSVSGGRLSSFGILAKDRIEGKARCRCITQEFQLADQMVKIQILLTSFWWHCRNLEGEEWVEAQGALKEMEEAEEEARELEEAEDLLEYYLQRAAATQSEAERLLAGARDLEESIGVSLSARRFEVLRPSLQSSKRTCTTLGKSRLLMHETNVPDFHISQLIHTQTRKC